MKKRNTKTCLSLLSIVSLFSLGGTAAATPLEASIAEVETSSPSPNVRLQKIIYKGSDLPSIDDPLGNNAVSARHDAGPSNTWGMSVEPECQSEACQRAERRWMSPTNWRQDRARGLSSGWGK